MNWINIDDNNFDYVKKRMSDIFNDNSNLKKLSKKEFDLLLDISSRVLYGVNTLCQEENIPYDIEGKLELFKFYDFDYTEGKAPVITAECAFIESLDKKNIYEAAKEGKETFGQKCIKLLGAKNQSPTELKDNFLDDNFDKDNLIQIIVHETLHYLDGYIKDEKVITTRFKHSHLPGFDFNIGVEQSTVDLSKILMERFFDKDYWIKNEPKPIVRRAIEVLNGKEIENSFIIPREGEGYNLALYSNNIFRLNGFRDFLKSYVCVDDSVFQQFKTFDNEFLNKYKKFLSNFGFLKNDESINLLKTLDKQIKGIERMFNEMKSGPNSIISNAEEFKERYISLNETIKDLFELKLERTEDLCTATALKLYFEKRQKNPETAYKNSEKAISKFFRESEKTYRELFRRNHFDEYLSMSIKLIDCSFIIKTSEKTFIPMENSLSNTDLKFYTNSFAIHLEDDKKALINAFEEIRDIKRENPNKKISFENFCNVAAKYGLSSVDILNNKEKELLKEREFQKIKEKELLKENEVLSL